MNTDQVIVHWIQPALLCLAPVSVSGPFALYDSALVQNSTVSRSCGSTARSLLTVHIRTISLISSIRELPTGPMWPSQAVVHLVAPVLLILISIIMMFCPAP